MSEIKNLLIKYGKILNQSRIYCYAENIIVDYNIIKKFCEDIRKFNQKYKRDLYIKLIDFQEDYVRLDLGLYKDGLIDVYYQNEKYYFAYDKINEFNPIFKNKKIFTFSKELNDTINIWKGVE